MPEIQKEKDPNVERQNTALLINLVMMFTESAMQQLGKSVNPMTGKADRNLEGAQTMIAMLEMLQAKTKGNVAKEEETVLKNAISSLQMNFVEELQAMNARGELEIEPEEAEEKKDGAPETSAQTSPGTAGKPEAKTAPPPEQKPEPTPLKPTEDTHKKFTKKYG